MIEDIPIKQEQNQDPTPAEVPQKVNIDELVKKFTASEKLMKREFRAKYQLAKNRLRADMDVRNRGGRKMTHENVNLVQSIGQNFVNSVYFKAPNCNLTAREDVEHEKVENTEIKTNDWLKDNKVKKVIKRCLWDAYLGGFGARFIDYEYQDFESENVIGYKKIAQPDPLSGQMMEVDDPNQPIRQRIVLKNDIVLKRIRPDLVRFPKGFDFDNYQDAQWLGFDVITPISEVKTNENWDAVIREKIKGERFTKLSDKDSTASDDSDELYAKISYYFEKPKTEMENLKLIVFCSTLTDAPLQETEFDKGQVGYPLKFIYFNPLDDDISYPNGDCWNFESQLAAVDIWWRKMVKHVERSNPKTIYDSGAISTTEIGKVKSNDDLEFAGVTNKQQKDLRSLFFEMQRAPVHPDVSRLYEVARQMISEISPKSGLSRGATDAEVDTATEAKIIQTGEIIDIEARIDDVKEFIVDIVLDVAGILEKIQYPVYITKKIEAPKLDPMTGQPVGTEEVDDIQKVGAEGFTSKINADVDVESMQSQNKDVFRRQLLDALKFLVNFEPIMNKVGKTLNPLFWLERVMETMNIRNVEKGVMDLPPIPLPITTASSTPIPGQPEGITGGIPPEATEAGMAERV